MSKKAAFSRQKEREDFCYKNSLSLSLSPCGGVHAPRIIRDQQSVKRERESYYRERKGRGDFERERERELQKSLLEEIRERVVCAVGERERRFVRERKDTKNSSLFVKRERGNREKVF